MAFRITNVHIDARTFRRVADTEWKDYTPYWCTPLGRILISRGTTFEECKTYCDEGCGAIEWWEGGSQACYLCTDLSLLIKFPYAQDLSYPPHVFIKQSGMSESRSVIPCPFLTLLCQKLQNTHHRANSFRHSLSYVDMYC